MTESKLMMHECRFVEAPIISVVAEQRIRADGLGPIIEWLESRDPRCLPKQRNYETHPTRISLLLPGRRWDPGSGSEPPDISTSDNELLAELAGRLCYRSFGEAAGRKTNADYMQHIFSMDPLHASILYHAKMTFFFAGVSRKFSHQFIRNYVGSDRTEEGSPCLAADTRIYGYRASDTQTHSWTIKELHDRQLTARGRDTLRRIRLRSATPDGVLVPGKIKRVISSGKKPVFEVITRSGRKIRATACHRFLTAEGWRRLRELSVGSRLMANGLPGWANREWIEQKYVHEAMTRPEVARLLGMSDSALGKVIRAMGIKKPLSLRRNRRGGAGKKGMHSAEGLKRIALSKMGERNPSWKGAGVSRKGACLRAKRVMPAVDPCWGCQTTRKVERHHLDENFLNNSPDNLISLCAKCHKAFHFEGSITVFSDEIVAITELPAEETFDIEMEEEPHNFVANGLVVHNSQESTRFCEHSGFYVIPPYALAAGGQTLENFKSASKTNWIVYQALLQQEWSAFEKQHGREPKGLEKKRILEACSSTLSQDSETSFIWTTNPMALRKFIHERGSAAADQEIARFTRKLLTICKWKWPHFFTDMEIPNGTE